MPSYGHATKVPLRPPKPRSNVITVVVQPTRVRGRDCFRTTFTVGGDPHIFLALRDQVEGGLRVLMAQLQAALQAGRAPASMNSDIQDIGRRFADLLLAEAPGGELDQAVRALAHDLAGEADLPIQISHNLPIPLEVLTFPESVGGIGDFAATLGGRPNIYYPTGTRSGRVPGSGAAFFHDRKMPGDDGQEWRDTLGRAFTFIDEHPELKKGDLTAAGVELAKLFESQASWAHFQCHAIYAGPDKKLRLTRNFEAEEQRFQKGGKYLVAVFLNCCRATELHQDALGPDGSLRSGWSEHFSSVSHVPAVIGPFVSLEGEQTVAFSDAFYSALGQDENVFDCFVTARQSRLRVNDATALVYRFMGLPSVVLPFSNRQAPVAA